MTASPHTHFRYVECDVPEGSSLGDWRRRDAAPCSETAPGAVRRLLQRVRRIARPSR